MGVLLRLDRRLELREQGAASVSVVTEMRKGTSTGWLAMIGPHSDPSLRHSRWERLQARPSEMEIVEGAGTKTYLELPGGFFEADSVRTDSIPMRVVFRVEGDRVEVLDSRKSRTDAVLADILGLTDAQLADARTATREQLRASATAAGLVELSGTPRQIEWVERFRLAKVMDASAYLEGRRAELAGLAEGDPARARTAEAVDWLAEAFDAIRDVADASWWIDRVEVKGRETLRAIARARRAEWRGVFK